MEIKTYTNVWNADRKMYRFQDINLPMPISFKQIGLFATGAVVWFPLMFLFQVPIATSWGAIMWFSLPVGLAWGGNKPIFGGKTIIQAIGSLFKFFMEPPILIDMEKPLAMESEGIELIHAKVWTNYEYSEYPEHIKTGKQREMYDRMEAKISEWEHTNQIEGALA